MKPKKPNPGESLAEINPELAKQWHPTKNGILTPYDVLPGSQKKVWWKCPEGDDHEWDAVILDRNNGIGCAVCSNYKVVKSNCLATLNPNLANEWHPSKNGILTPEDVHPGSAKKVWWKCQNGDDHEWKTVIYSRTGGKGCPICSGRKVVKSNCLATLNPNLATEWHSSKNGKLTPKDVGLNSGKKVWWKCPEGDDHEWKSTVRNRAIGLGCPICSNQKVVLSNCLATLNPELAKQWHPTKNDKLTPYEVGAGSGKDVWWECPEGKDHVWKSSIKKRNKGRGCPICIGRKVVKSNSFATLYPELAKQWHPTKNGKLTPHDIRPSSNIKVWWLCLRGDDHIWKTSVNDRTSGTGCPKCNSHTSAPEMRIFCEIRSIFPSTQHRFILKGFEVDIYIPELKFGIEYDGSYWHQDKIQKDQKKNLALQSEIFLLRIREKGLPKLSNTDIALKTENIPVALIKKILRLILNHCQIESPDVLDRIHKYLKCTDWIASDYFEKLQTERNNVVFEKSISFLFPDLAKQWHPTKNEPLLPEHFTLGSHKNVWWQNYLGLEWQAQICDRVRTERNQRN
jgi:very-short-patch-repair endonuclease